MAGGLVGLLGGILRDFSAGPLEAKLAGYIENRGEEEGLNEIYNYIQQYSKHKGTSSDPYDEDEKFILSHTRTVLRQRHISSNPLIEKLVNAGHNRESLCRYLA